MIKTKQKYIIKDITKDSSKMSKEQLLTEYLKLKNHYFDAIKCLIIKNKNLILS
jgi:hypothetical protein